MSDVQRYTLNLYAPVMDEDHNGKYVKYDDHIAIVDKKDFVIRSMQTRMDKLEKAMYQAVYNSKAIKAEGIREMLNAFDETLTPENDISCYSLEDFADEYADKLASDNEALEKGDE